ncbi:NAD-dependent succinate-semialdehyde dehydrogenase [Sphingomonas sp. IW22]|uniref:NAD-dependent succinate-semialdehyde dehydrogenase n=1 Tax=Sphingomonas sp. IW22 TaxID=3242489 RepID=UPI003522D45A
MSEYVVIDPATDSRIAVYPEASGADIEHMLATAQKTYDEWSSSTSVSDRAAKLNLLAEIFVERENQLAAIIHQEVGKPVADSVDEVRFSAEILRAFANNSEKWLADEELHVKDGMRTVIKRQGIGIILGIMPWNYPYYQVVRFAAPNLLLGNTVIIKHANQCPASAKILEEMFLDAGFPAGAYTNVYATHDQISTLIADDRLQGVSLTGSERAGAIVAEQAGRNLKKCVLELGGSDPFIVLDTADVENAVKHAVWGRMKNMGQSCTGSKRFIVIESVFDEFKEKFIEALKSEAGVAEFPPLSSRAATTTLVKQVETALKEGAQLEIGDNLPNGNFYKPAVLTNITPDMSVYSEELFGPVAQLYCVSSDDEAVRLANDNPYGLGSVVICDDIERAERVGDRLEVGMVYLNAAGLDGADVPFGGIKKSGFGRELGRLSIDEFANKKIYRYG